jgi:hypothetical protein
MADLCTKLCCYLEELVSVKVDILITVEAYLPLLASAHLRHSFLTYIMREGRALDFYEFI